MHKEIRLVVHETGHYMTGRYFGREVEMFRPYPSKIIYKTAEGKDEEKWVGGFVKFRAEQSVNTNENTWIFAMGSGTNLLSVLVLSPLLPSVHGFGREALDRMLFYSAFDMPGYALVSMFSDKNFGDWNYVAKLTGISTFSYFLMSLPVSILVNSYRRHWSEKARKKGDSNYVTPAFTLGFKF